MATWEEHLVRVRVTAEGERFTVADLIELGKDLQKAVERGLAPSTNPSFVIDGSREYVKEINVVGDIPKDEPKKAPAKKTASRRPKKTVESSPPEQSP